jgi:hypothetical protein
MRILHIYLAIYFALIMGAGFALWQAGVLGRLSFGSVILAAIVVVGLGVLLAVTSSRPTVRS